MQHEIERARRWRQATRYVLSVVIGIALIGTVALAGRL